jgi:hypothetical protein
MPLRAQTAVKRRLGIKPIQGFWAAMMNACDTTHLPGFTAFKKYLLLKFLAEKSQTQLPGSI